MVLVGGLPCIIYKRVWNRSYKQGQHSAWNEKYWIRRKELSEMFRLIHKSQNQTERNRAYVPCISQKSKSCGTQQSLYSVYFTKIKTKRNTSEFMFRVFHKI